MKRLFLSVTITCLVAALLVNTVFALVSGPPDHDSFIRTTAPDSNFDTQDLSIAASTTSCTPTDITYMQWDLSDISAGETVQTASLTLTASFVSNTGSAMLSLYETGDGWTESTLTYNNAPAVGNLIETKAAPTASGQTVTFNSAALATYINNEAAGDNAVSFALRFSSGCAAGLTLVLFEDEESNPDKPYLQVQNPNAVVLQSLHATSPTPMWNIAPEFMLGVLGLALIGGLVTGRVWRHL